MSDFFKRMSRGCTFGKSARSQSSRATKKTVCRRQQDGQTALDFFGQHEQLSKNTPPSTKNPPAVLSDEEQDNDHPSSDLERATPPPPVSSKKATATSKIKVSSDNPDAWESFDVFAENGVSSSLLRSLTESLKFSEPTPIQSQTVPSVLTGRDVLASAPTGSGKTVAFLLPTAELLLRSRSATTSSTTSSGFTTLKPELVVLDPTRELARQTLREWDRLVELSPQLRGMGSSLLDGGGSSSSSVTVSTKNSAVVACTPLKLVQMLTSKELSFENVKSLVLDEVDKLLDLGFREQVDAVLAHLPENCRKCVEEPRSGETELVEEEPALKKRRKQKGKSVLIDVPQKQLRKNTQILFFSATLPPNVVELAESVLRNPLTVHIGSSAAACPDVAQRLLFVGREDAGSKLFTLRTLLSDGALKFPCLVFVQAKDRAKELHDQLRLEPCFRSSSRVDYLTAERSKEDRDKAVNKFRTGQTWVLICTDMVSRGVDFKGVQMVLNYDLPVKQSTYIHRIGRTGRAGRKGDAISFFTEADLPVMKPIVNVLKNSGCSVPEWLGKGLKKPRKHRQHKEAEFRQVYRAAVVAGGCKKKQKRGKKNAASSGDGAGATVAGLKREKVGGKGTARGGGKKIKKVVKKSGKKGGKGKATRDVVGGQ